MQAHEPTDRLTVEENRASLLAYFESRRPYRKALGQTVFPNPLQEKLGRRRRNTKPGWSPREKSPCGTEGAYQRHVKLGEPKDEACIAAHAEYARAGRERRKARLQDAA